MHGSRQIRPSCSDKTGLGNLKNEDFRIITDLAFCHRNSLLFCTTEFRPLLEPAQQSLWR